MFLYLRVLARKYFLHLNNSYILPCQQFKQTNPSVSSENENRPRYGEHEASLSPCKHLHRYDGVCMSADCELHKNTLSLFHSHIATFVFVCVADGGFGGDAP